MTTADAAAGGFIRAAEIWLPSRDRMQLEHAGGWYGSAPQLAQVSRDMVFGRGEGLPGRAWATAAPVVLHGFDPSTFKRTPAALADGLTCGIALPIFCADYLMAVLVFFCSDQGEQAGAIEVWHTDPRIGPDMGLEDGHYGRTAETFEYLSRRTRFRHGTGLPGLAWAARAPVLMPDLGRAAGFMRGDSAQRVGINRGLAMPCATPGPDLYVITWLSALGTPIARRLEVWQPDAEQAALRLQAGFCEHAGTLAPAPDAAVQRGEGALGRCWLTGLPTLGTAAAEGPGPASGVPGLASVLAFPVLDQGRFVAAVAMYF